MEAVFDAPPDAVLEALALAAEDWEGEWRPRADPTPGRTSGHLYLPIVAGLRQGLLELAVTVEPGSPEEPGEDEGTRLSLQPLAGRYHLNTSAVGVLAIAAVGGLMVLIWPFFPAYPELVQLAPLGAILALVGWFLVVSRLTNQGPEEFLSLVRLGVEGTEENGSIRRGEVGEVPE